MLRRPPRLRTVLLLSNLAVLALPIAGLWALRLYESALVRQTESELVAQAAVLASIFREQLHLPPEAAPPGTPAQPGAAALHMARRPGLDLATTTVLPPEPDATPAPPAESNALAAGQALTPVLRDAQSVTLASLRITDRNGTVVATTGADAGQSLAGWDEVARVLAGEPIVTTMHRRDPATAVPGGIVRTAGLRVFVALPVSSGGAPVGVVVLSRTPNDVGQAIWGKRRPLAGLLALLLAGGAALAAAISRLVTRPLSQVVAQSQAVASGATVQPLPRPGTREVAELSDAIIRMARTLEQRAGYITGFAASVSHEFKTPLAAIRAAAELLDDHAGTLTTAEKQHLLGLISGGVARLDLLVRRLLDLARADMLRPPETAQTLIAPVLHRVAARYRKRGLTVSVAAETTTTALSADALDAMLASLLDNVSAHAPHAAASIDARLTGSCVEITVRDDGPGIPAANQAAAFDPFFTTARHSGGTGLGLPIVRAIAASAGGSALLLSTETGTAIRVTLPALPA